MRYAFLSLLLAVLALGCVTETGEPIGLPVQSAMSTEQEVQMGAQMAAQIEQQAKVLNDPVVQNYVREIGQRLAVHAPRQDVPYQFTVIDDPETVNAFALPGGHLYVFTGLMRLAENEAELASVMAHEIAHVAGHHHGEMLRRQMNAQALAGLLLGDNPGVAAQIAAGLINQGWQAGYSRANEAEADQLGMDMMFKAGYQPVAMLTFMNKMVQLDQQQGGGGRLFAIFASHPPTTERLARLQALLNQYPEPLRAQRGVFRERYQQMAASRIVR